MISELQTFGHNLRVLRADARLSQEELGNKANLNADSIGKYERCEAVPSLTSVCSLAKALGCTPNDLLGWDKAR